MRQIGCVITKKPSTERKRKMKTKLIAITVIMALIGTMWVPKAHAGDKEWATAGKILTGIAALSILSAAAEDHHDNHYNYSRSRPYRDNSSYNRRRVYQAEPVYHDTRVYRHEAPRRRARNKHWVPGHYVTENVRVWVPGQKIKTWVEPRYEKVWVGNNRHGHWEDVIVTDGYWTYEYLKGHYEIQRNQRWVPGYWENI